MFRLVLAALFAAGGLSAAIALQPSDRGVEMDGRIHAAGQGQYGAMLYSLDPALGGPASELPEAFVLRAHADDRALCIARPDGPDWGCFSECPGEGGLINEYGTARRQCHLAGRCSPDGSGGMSCRTVRPIGTAH